MCTLNARNLTVVNIKNEELFPRAQRVNDIDVELLCHLLDLANISDVVLVAITRRHVFGEVNIEIIHNVW